MMTMRNHVWPLCLAAFLFLAAVQAAFFPLGAAAETALVAEATLLPADAESASPYRIVLTAPGGWSSGNSAVMKVSVTDINHIGWQKIEYRMNESAWIDCESQFADGKAELALHENGTFTLRVTDPQGHAFEESAQVVCIDLTAPVLSASINGTLLSDNDDLAVLALVANTLVIEILDLFHTVLLSMETISSTQSKKNRSLSSALGKALIRPPMHFLPPTRLPRKRRLTSIRETPIFIAS